jgi:hypothetical protein
MNKVLLKSSRDLQKKFEKKLFVKDKELHHKEAIMQKPNNWEQIKLHIPNLQICNCSKFISHLLLHIMI